MSAGNAAGRRIHTIPSKTKRVHFQGRPRLSLRILGFGMSGSRIDQALSESSIPSLDQNYQPLSITSTTTTTTTSASASTRPEVFVRYLLALGGMARYR